MSPPFTPLTPFDAMQMAVDAVALSPHPSNKIAACIFNEQNSLAEPNAWPRKIFEHFSPETRIGNSSGTVHAEVNCILNFQDKTEGTSLCITDPFCPNCAKNLAEAGIKNIYIDHKGFAKDFAQRRGEEFENMSLRIAQRAGINVYIINRKEKIISPIIENKKDYTPYEDNPIKIIHYPPNTIISETALINLIQSTQIIHPRWGCALTKDIDDNVIGLVASSHPAIGYTKTDLNENQTEGKYNFWLEPINRLITGIKRHGYMLPPTIIFTSQIPTSRELVNAVAAGITKIYCAEMHSCRDDDGIKAAQLLQGQGIIEIIKLNI